MEGTFRRPRIVLGALFFAWLTGVAATGGEIAPVELQVTASGPGHGVYSERTLRVGIEVDRHQARVLSYTIKDRPYLRLIDPEEARVYRADEWLQVEVVLLGPDDRRHTRRWVIGPLCLDHEPYMAAHIEGDVVRRHRDSFVIELPEIAGFDRIEIAYHESYRGTTTRKTLGVERLDGARYDPAGGAIPYEGLAIAGSSDATPTGGNATVLWPEDFADPDIYRIDGDPAEGDRRVNIVIVPDGYTHSNKSLMERHADGLIAYMRQTTPMAEHDPFVNYTLVYAYSLENGTDQCDCDVVLNTAMGTRFPEVNPQCGHSDNRCLSYGGGCDESGTDNIVAAELRAPYHDETVVMVNTTRYGGCAGLRATYSAANSAGEDVGTHEVGHSVLGLADEYVSNSGCGSNGGEVNTSTNPTEGAWPEWIDDLGAPREGARYWSQCIYRPENYCKMRSLYQPFCAVCSQRGSLVFFGHPRVSPTAPVESASTAPAQVLIDSQVEFSVTTRFGQGTVTNSITWSVQGPGDLQPIVVATDVEDYSHLLDRLGDYTVICDVIADTNLIKPEKYDGNRDTVVWNIEAVATVCEIGCADGIPECDADNDGLGDNCDPCPAQPLNECFGPVALDNMAGVDTRINTDSTSSDACSGAKTDCRGKTWIADFGAPDSSSGYNQAGDPHTCDLASGCPVDATPVFGCSDLDTEDLFRCGHHEPVGSPNLIYTFDVPDGEYLLNLLFMNASVATQDPGNRVFSVAINGVVPDQLAQFDQVVAAGGRCDPTQAPCEPVSRSVSVTVSGGSGLVVEFLGEIEQPAIKGIELLCATSVWYRDADNDGYGDAGDSVVTCYQPAGYVRDATDCDDDDATAHPGAPEICDSADNDCDEAIDEDVDGDGFGVCADCDESDPCHWAIPGAVLNLRFLNKVRLMWDDPTDLGGLFGDYVGLRSTVATDFTTAQCLPASPQAKGLIDVLAPAPDQVSYYLVYARSPCEDGTLGTDSAGNERQGRICLDIGSAGCRLPPP